MNFITKLKNKNMYDILIKGGTVIDGTGVARVRADVAVDGATVVAIGDLAGKSARKVIDARGKFVTPGFIDVNNHSDAYWKLFDNPTLDSMIHQGVTTIIGGNSGASLAPLIRPEAIKSIQKWTDISGVNINWQTMDDLYVAVAKRSLATNFGSLVGHSTLRRALLGDEHRELTSEELDILAQELDEAMLDGALGLSVAIGYTHGRATTEEELERLAQVVAQRDGVWVVYLSDERDGILDSLEQKMQIAQKTGVRLHLSHIKVIGSKNWHLMEQVLGMVAQAREQGAQITADVYPYTVMSAVLYTLLPDWVTDGGRKMMLRRLADATVRERVEAELAADDTVDLGSIVLSVSPLMKYISNRRLSEIAKSQEKSVASALIDVLLASEGHAVVLIDAIDPRGMRSAMSANGVMIASNGGGYSEEDWHTGEIIHPRSFGAFAQFLGKFVRDEKLITWEQAIAKITSEPATQYRLVGRGEIKVRKFADITVFDPAVVNSRASIKTPYRYAIGVEHVIVNGQIAYSVSDEDTQIARYGRILQRK